MRATLRPEVLDMLAQHTLAENVNGLREAAGLRATAASSANTHTFGYYLEKLILSDAEPL